MRWWGGGQYNWFWFVLFFLCFFFLFFFFRQCTVFPRYPLQSEFQLCSGTQWWDTGMSTGKGLKSHSVMLTITLLCTYYFSLVLITVSQAMEVIRVCLCWHTQTIINGCILFYYSHRLAIQCTYIHMMCRIFLTLVCQSTYFLSPLLSSPLLSSPLFHLCPLYERE